MKDHILLFNVPFIPLKSHVVFQSYGQLYFINLRHKTIKKNI